MVNFGAKARRKANGRSKLSRSLKRLGSLRWRPCPKLLLGPTIPQPMHGVNPRTILGRKWWDEQRRKACRKTDFHCQACGAWEIDAKGKQRLESHEVYRIDYARGRMYFVGIVPLCSYCHEFIHIGRLQALMENGEISQSHYVAVITHGDKVLKSAGLTRLPVYNGKIAPWPAWRLVLNRHRYLPLYKSQEEWEAKYGKIP